MLTKEIKTKINITPVIGSGGFGNEFFQVAKAWICAQKLQISYRPFYGRNVYFRDFFDKTILYTNYLHYQINKIDEKFNYVTKNFGQEEHLKTNIIPIELAVKSFLENNCNPENEKTLLKINGLYPGLEAIENYHSDLYNLLSNNQKLSQNVECCVKHLSQDKIRVGVHIRRGDFREPLPIGVSWPKGKWNIQIPLEWYDNVCSLIQSEFANDVSFVLFTNSFNSEIETFTSKYNCYANNNSLSGNARSYSDVVDLLTLSHCDVIISSISWFSGWAITLGQVPFIWYPYAHGLPAYGQNRSFELNGYESVLPDNLKSLIIKHYNQRKSNFITHN